MQGLNQEVKGLLQQVNYLENDKAKLVMALKDLADKKTPSMPPAKDIDKKTPQEILKEVEELVKKRNEQKDMLKFGPAGESKSKAEDLLKKVEDLLKKVPDKELEKQVEDLKKRLKQP